MSEYFFEYDIDKSAMKLFCDDRRVIEIKRMTMYKIFTDYGFTQADIRHIFRDRSFLPQVFELVWCERDNYSMSYYTLSPGGAANG